MSPGYPCCCDDSCDYCTGTPPAQLQVDFGNVANADCSECVTYYGQSFILDRSPTDACRWTFSEDDWCDDCESGETSTVITAYYEKIGSNYYIHVVVSVCHCCGIGSVAVTAAEFRYDFGTSAPACVPASAISLSPYNTGFWNSNVACDWDDTVVTCEVSSV